MAYVASIHKASSVRHAIKAHFLSPDEPSLIVAKSNCAEIFDFSASGLTSRTSLTVYGTINCLLSFHPSNSPTEHLFIATEDHDYFTVSWDAERGTIRNEILAQNVADKFLRDAPAGAKYLADPGGRMLGVHVYEGLFLAIPTVQMEKKGRKKSVKASEIGSLDEHCPIRMKELKVVDLTFLHGTSVPVLAILHRGGKTNSVHLETYQIVRSGGTCEFQEWEIKSSNLEAEANMLIPLPEPLGGVLVLGEQTVVYFPVPGGQAHAIKRPLAQPTVFYTWGMVDNQRYLLSDETGKLKMLFLDLDEDGNVSEIKVEMIGQTSIASKILYLDNGHVFIGSHYGDSQLVKLSSFDPKLQVIQNFPSLAPILDFQVISSSQSGTEDQPDQYSSGQSRIVSGCGGFTAGGLRSVRNGVGLKDSAILAEWEGGRGLWALRSDVNSGYQDTLLVSFIDETRAFGFDAEGEGEVEELEEFKSFSLDEETLTAVNLPGERLLQVTPSRIKLVDLESGTLLSEITPTSKIISASVSYDKLICNVGSKSIVVYNIAGVLEEVKGRVFEHEIACLFAAPDFPDVCAVGFWTSALVQLLSLPGLEPLAQESLGGGAAAITIPRSIVMARVLEKQPPTLLVAMGDGTLYTFSVNDKASYVLSHKKSVALGTQAFYFQTIPRKDDIVSVFAACDHPTLIYSDDGRLMYSAVTAENVTYLTPFNTQSFPSSVAVLAGGELKISTVDTTRNIHVKTLTIGDVVRRVSYSKERQVHGIVTVRHSFDVSSGEEKFSCFVSIVDDTEFAIVDSYKLRERELVECILCAKLDNGDGTKSDKFVVGTGFQSDQEIEDEEPEPQEGRLLVFEFSEDRKLKLAADLKVDSIVKCIDIVNDNIVAALNKTIDVFSFKYPNTPTKPELIKLITYRCHSEPLDLGVFGDMIAVGDMMKGPAILQYSSDPSPKLMETCRTFSVVWTTAIDMMDKDTLINADAEGNISIWQRDDALMVADRKRLRLIGDMCLGEMVNRIRRVDALPQQRLAQDVPIQPVAYIATVEGSIYLLGKISEAKTQLLLQLQANLAKFIDSIGGLQFNRWRAFSTPGRSAEEPYRFVDGDFIERFLELPEDVAEKVVKGGNSELYALDASVDEVRGLVESLKAVH
ncbi:mono-functional DNA-alkylating methyl methanesulfonate N-term-domain-containing protein [Sphaerosporella brunnea]|uniref:DNA damage-binding protein 1 n=1 Tax=Sphaerosporella brunnea TaxID=1250544 RepID=A0A5J5EVU1_9PEZI|nr:mono-functional DNA-alkylating methyl methanesulfonate N-term-domain-containing protein [Sphaerosporella brunnea]